MRVGIGIAALVALLTADAALAQVVPWHSLIPRPRPATIGPSISAMPSGAIQRALPTDAAVAQALAMGRAQSEAVARSLMPRPRPPAAAARFAAARQSAPATPTRAVASGGGGRTERGLCGDPALEGQRLPRITSTTRGCGIDEPVSVTSVHGIPLTRASTLHCDTARTFARWVDGALLPEVGRRGGGVARIRIIGDYSCRTRNSRPGARISEHGRGMAIDVAGYQLRNGDWVTVQDDWRRGRDGRQLRAMYGAACGMFTTTLSPDSDRYHQDHFHFDLARHRGGGTYCR